MKNSICYILIGCCLVFTSCDKRLSSIEPEYFINTRDDLKTVEDYDQVLKGAYKGMLSTSYYANNMLLTDVMTEDGIQGTTSYLDGRELVDWVYSPISVIPTNTWMAIYNVVARTNLVLTGMQKIASGDAVLKKKVLGQAYAIRAMAFFDILRLYGEAYDRNSTAQGIVIRKTVDIQSLERATVKESYDQIILDLEAALNELTGVMMNPAGSNNYYFDEWGVRALLARVYLYAGENQKAYDYATAVISSPRFRLENSTEFSKIWREDKHGGEVILALRVNLVDNIRVATFLSDYDPLKAGYAKRNFYDPSATLAALYDKTNDIRYKAYFSDTIKVGITGAAARRPILTKYSGRNASWDNIEDIKLIRLSEMYLIRAEAALNGAGQGEADALKDLQSLKGKRISNYVAEQLAGTALKDAISKERRREFSYEAQAWFDLRRSQTPVNRNPTVFTSSKATNRNLSADSYLWAWPIPFAEVFNADGVAVKQNNGYK